MKSSLLFFVCILVSTQVMGQTSLTLEMSGAAGDEVCCGLTLAQAFDKNTSTGPLLTSLPASIGYSFESPLVVDAYRWHSKTGSSNSDQPTSWHFQGSANGSTWVTLHSVTESSLVDGWTEYFKFKNRTPYRHFRMHILTSRSKQVCIGELEMFKLYDPSINAKQEVALTGDNNSNGRINPGERLTYTLTVGNSGYTDAQAVKLSDLVPAHTTFVDGSIKTSAIANNDSYLMTNVNVSFAGGSVLKNDFGLPALTVTSFGDVGNPSAVLANGENVGISEKGGVVKFNADGTFLYTPVPGFEGNDSFAYTASSGILPNDVGLVTVSVSSPIITCDDTYLITGNVYNTQQVSTGLLSNDAGTSLVLTEVEGKRENVGVPVLTAKGGSVNVKSDGSFIYSPPVGYAGNDQFSYTVNNPLNIPKTAKVNLSISGMFWFVNNAAFEPGNGTFASPFNDLASFNHVNNGIGNNPGAGDNIILYSGNKEYSGCIKLLDNQKLIGQGSGRSIEEITGSALASGSAPLPDVGGASPVMSNLSGSALSLSRGNTISGLIIGNCSESAVTGRSFEILSVEEVRINTTGQALNLTDGTLKGSFASLNSLGGVHNIYLKNIQTDGVFLLGASVDHLSGAVNDALKIDGDGGSFSFPGNISNTNTLAVNITNKVHGVVNVGDINALTFGRGVSVSNCSGGTVVNFIGKRHQFSTKDEPAISLMNNSGAYINFKGGNLNIITSNSDGFIAFQGGVITVTGSNNVISSSEGTALKVVNTIIGEAGLTFKSISANGGRNGIVLDNTGSSAGLTITGDGVKCASGGVIQRAKGADGEAYGNGIYLRQTNKTDLNFMILNDHQNNAIYGTSVHGLNLNRIRITGINGTDNTAAFKESSIQLVDADGIISVTSSFISGGVYNNILVDNISSKDSVLEELIFDADTIDAVEDVGTDARNAALQVTIGSGVAHTKILNSRIYNWRGDGIKVTYKDMGTGTLEIFSNDVNNSLDAPINSAGISVFGGELLYTIANNNVQNSKYRAIAAEKESPGKYMRGTITGNTIGTSGVANSGAVAGYGIHATHRGLSTTSVTISNNRIYQVGGSDGIRVWAGDDQKDGSSGQMNVIIKDNAVAEPGESPLNGIFVMCGYGPNDKGLMCLDLRGNSTLKYSRGFTVKQKKLTRVNLVGYTGYYNNMSGVSLYLRSVNSTTVATVESTGGGYYNTEGGVTCPQ